jgi:hypothetical protein
MEFFENKENNKKNSKGLLGISSRFSVFMKLSQLALS